MAFQKFFKQEEPKKKAAPKKASVKETESATQEEKVQPLAKELQLEGNAILKHVHVTEKAVDLTAQNQYVFEVYPEATKRQVQDAVQKAYSVTVEQVRMIRIPAKQVRFRGRRGHKPGYKKAIVELQKGQKIDVLPT